MAHGNRYLILGSGIAGMAAAEGIRQTDPEAEICMVSAEKELCFNRPMLIQEFALDGSGAALFERQQEWPEQFDVEVMLGKQAIGIDSEAKCVYLEGSDSRSNSDSTSEPMFAPKSAPALKSAPASESGPGSLPEPEVTRLSYDRLIYALGAEVTIPPIPGADREHVHVVRTREDMRKIREAMRSAEHAVVIGGGMLGLEDAWALKEEKLQVAIIERKQRVAFGQIDQSAGNLMKKRIERMGVPVYVNAEVTEIGDGYVTFRQEMPASLSASTSGQCEASVQCGVPQSNNGAKAANASGQCEASVQCSAPLQDGSPEAGACFGCAGCPVAQGSDELVTIPADLVIFSTGVTPNSQLGAKAGLATVGSSVSERTKRESSDAKTESQTSVEEEQLGAGCVTGCCGGTGSFDGDGICEEFRIPRWIAVDECCRTSDPSIFAAGDCAAVNGRNDAIWDEAREMGWVAGINAALTASAAAAGAASQADAASRPDGAPCRSVDAPCQSDDAPNRPVEHDGGALQIYRPVTAEHVFTGFDTEVFTMADSSGAGTDGVYIRHADVEIFDYQRERYIRVSLQDGSIAGVLLINAPELAPELMQAYYEGAGEEEAREIIQRWKDSHEVDFKPAAGFRRR